MNKKDYFSEHAKIYAAFRPTYPKDLYGFIYKHLKEKQCAWDCATGNGQVAHVLAKEFKQVYATDISKQQIEQAAQESNIHYSVSAAESTNFPNHRFDLITVGQALHWFQTDQFYQEVNRTGKKEGLVAVWGYALLTVSPAIDLMFMDFYNNIVGPYWDEARRLIENKYKTVPFPFKQIETPEFEIEVRWNRDQFSGYLTSWSATQKFMKVNGYNPVDKFMFELAPLWTATEIKSVKFPVFLKLGRIG
jgi:hypothetical protein